MRTQVLWCSHVLAAKTHIHLHPQPHPHTTVTHTHTPQSHTPQSHTPQSHTTVTHTQHTHATSTHAGTVLSRVPSAYELERVGWCMAAVKAPPQQVCAWGKAQLLTDLGVLHACQADLLKHVVNVLNLHQIQGTGTGPLTAYRYARLLLVQHDILHPCTCLFSVCHRRRQTKKC